MAKAIAQEAAAAAAESRDAANQAAQHASAAGDAAYQAYLHAGESAGQADKAQAAADAADLAADQAEAAANSAGKVSALARKADAERLLSQQNKQIQEAQAAKQAEADRAAAAAWEAGQQARLNAEAQRLLDEARNPATAPAVVVSNGRKVAVRLHQTGGPWVRQAAEFALTGTETDVTEFVRTALAVATERDDRASTGAIADSTAKPAQRAAALTAMAGNHDQVKEFLRTRYYPGKDDDDRIELARIMNEGGPGVRQGAQRALSGTIEQVREFLATGQHTARRADDAVLVGQALNTGGPEVKAAAQAALSGPDSYVRTFVTSGIPRAQQRDADTAAHVAEIGGYLAAASRSAAGARQDAFTALSYAATARQAANEAAEYANQATASAERARQFAAQAAASADQAERSAADAARSAQLAREAEAAAHRSASQAQQSVIHAQDSATRADQSANSAKAAADRARADAIAAGESAADAARLAREAADRAAELERQEAEARRRAEDEARKPEPAPGQPARPDDPNYEAAKRNFFGGAPADGAHKVWDTNARMPGRGIIMMRFFIHSDDAAFGLLDGDDRGFSMDPGASSRIIAAWDTDTGKVSYTVTKSTKEGGYIWSPGGAVRVPDRVYPAHPITPGGDNDLRVRIQQEGYLAADYTGLNGLLPLFQVNGRVEVKIDSQVGTKSYIGGDDYPDFEVVQYWKNEAPRSLGTDEMSALQGVASAPLMGHRSVSWLNGQPA
ncbi:ALF repeat-containing protein [Amycolatopsis sp. 195334CR]|nr:ALF repeat-containing protein [Amycolatopsis sp. 195334CR]